MQRPDWLHAMCKVLASTTSELYVVSFAAVTRRERRCKNGSCCESQVAATSHGASWKQLTYQDLGLSSARVWGLGIRGYKRAILLIIHASFVPCTKVEPTKWHGTIDSEFRLCGFRTFMDSWKSPGVWHSDVHLSEVSGIAWAERLEAEFPLIVLPHIPKTTTKTFITRSPANTHPDPIYNMSPISCGWRETYMHLSANSTPSTPQPQSLPQAQVPKPQTEDAADGPSRPCPRQSGCKPHSAGRSLIALSLKRERGRERERV